MCILQPLCSGHRLNFEFYDTLKNSVSIRVPLPMMFSIFKSPWHSLFFKIGLEVQVMHPINWLVIYFLRLTSLLHKASYVTLVAVQHISYFTDKL